MSFWLNFTWKYLLSPYRCEIIILVQYDYNSEHKQNKVYFLCFKLLF